MRFVAVGVQAFNSDALRWTPSLDGNKSVNRV